MLFSDQMLQQKILENMHDAVLILDKDLNIIDNNHVANKWYGYTDQEFKTLNLRDVRAPSERNKIAMQMSEVDSNQGSMWETIHQAKDGSTFKVEVSSIPIEIGDEKRFYHVVRDISNRNVKSNVLDLQHIETLAYLTKHDPITGLANRNYFEQTLDIELHNAKQKHSKFAVIFIDIEGFIIVNEAMGHAAGDELLRIIANRLQNLNVRQEYLARFGPQFAVLLEEFDKLDDITGFIKQINQTVAIEVTLQDQGLSLLLNYGIAVYPDDGMQVNDLLRSAGVALTGAKEIGGGAVQFCDVELSARAQKRIKLENDLRHALARQEFYLQYQPIIDTTTMTTTGFEALIRWNHNGKPVSPAEFIPLAEKSHYIVQIGEWIVRTACLQAKAWLTMVDNPIFMSVNISPIQFRRGAVLDMLTEVIAETAFDPNYLKIEITESALMENAQKSINMLRDIKEMGIKISIDDFGTGYSSLNYLRHLPIDYIKIDQSFVRNITTDKNDAAIVKTIIDLAHNLQYNVIAEGVETKEQLDVLTSLGCNNIQGYYISQPLNADDATKFLRQGKVLR